MCRDCGVVTRSENGDVSFKRSGAVLGCVWGAWQSNRTVAERVNVPGTLSVRVALGLG